MVISISKQILESDILGGPSIKLMCFVALQGFRVLKFHLLLFSEFSFYFYVALDHKPDVTWDENIFNNFLNRPSDH